ncbi:MAG: class I SAM-dependent methyltransferase [Candidatus Aminicenantes bacterium]|nr:MAG: class I SAM-dependent methyltransferase [Candidatus Aminicenantes bacterium]
MSTKELFNEVAQYYAVYRPGVPMEAVNYLIDRFKLNSMSQVLDLGCGTGQLARSLCKHVAKVICVDSGKEMIRLAQKTIKSIVGCNGKVQLICKKAEEFSMPMSSLDLVTICRAFHWMNHDVVLRKYNSTLRPGGGFAILGDSSLWNGNEPWQKTAKKTIQHFLGEKRRAGDKYFSVSSEPYDLMLKRYGYVDIDVKEFEVIRFWNIDSIFGYLYSTSFSSRKMYGDKLQEFEKMLKSELGNPDPKNVFKEKSIFTIQSGRKMLI